jgi:O-antigen/teichoic acid export membrane protein
VIGVLFGHRADSAGVLKTASIFLRFLGVQVFLTPINVLSSRLLSACQRVRNAVAYQICFSVVLFGMFFIFVHMFGAVGYAVALAAMYGANVLVLYWLLKVSTPFVDYGAVLRGLGAVAGVSVICLAFAYAVFGLFSRQPVVFPLGVGGMFACFMLLASRCLADVIDIRELRVRWPRSRAEGA